MRKKTQWSDCNACGIGQKVTMWPSFEQLCLCRSYPNHATTVLYDTSTISPYRHLSTVLYSSIVLYSSTQFNSSTVLYSSPALQQQQPLPLLRPNYPPIVILLISQSVKKEPVTTASAASPSTLTAHYAVKSTTTTPTTPTYFPFVYVHPTPTTYHLPPRRDLYNYLLLHTSLLCPVPLHTSYLTCSSTTTTWTTTSDEQHVKPQNHTVIVTKLQRSIVTFSSTEDRKRKEKSSVIEPIPWVKISYVIQSIRL